MHIGWKIAISAALAIALLAHLDDDTSDQLATSTDTLVDGGTGAERIPPPPDGASDGFGEVRFIAADDCSSCHTTEAELDTGAELLSDCELCHINVDTDPEDNLLVNGLGSEPMIVIDIVIIDTATTDNRAPVTAPGTTFVDLGFMGMGFGNEPYGVPEEPECGDGDGLCYTDTTPEALLTATMDSALLALAEMEGVYATAVPDYGSTVQAIWSASEQTPPAGGLCASCHR